jgi:hypothetical protein
MYINGFNIVPSCLGLNGQLGTGVVSGSDEPRPGKGSCDLKGVHTIRRLEIAILTSEFAQVTEKSPGQERG